MLPHTKALEAATGMKITMGDLMRIGARGFNLERMINARMGVSAKDDKLPKRLTEEEQVPGDPRTKVPQPLLKKKFYFARGWDEDGKVKAKTAKYYSIDSLDDIGARAAGENDKK